MPPFEVFCVATSVITKLFSSLRQIPFAFFRSPYRRERLRLAHPLPDKCGGFYGISCARPFQSGQLLALRRSPIEIAGTGNRGQEWFVRCGILAKLALCRTQGIRFANT